VIRKTEHIDPLEMPLEKNLVAFEAGRMLQKSEHAAPFEVPLKRNYKMSSITSGQMRQENRSMLTPLIDLSVVK
jgi:hypothetical protein